MPDQDSTTRTKAPVLLHVGLHKTGTTWLQDRVFTNHALGFDSPWGPMASPAIAEFMLVDPLAFDASAAKERLLPDIESSRAKGFIPVVSHEGLSSRPTQGMYYAPAVAERLKAVFPDARVVIGIREQTGMILSLYRQHVRTGGSNTLRQFIGTGKEEIGWAPLCRLEFFHYDRFVRLYQSHFGEDNVLILPLERLKESEDTYLRTLLEFAGSSADPKDIGDAAPSNVGWGGQTLEIFRFMGRFVRRDPLSHRQPFGVRTAQRICYKLDGLIPKSRHKAIESRWKAMIKERCAGEFEESNARLAAMTGLDLKAMGYPVT